MSEYYLEMFSADGKYVIKDDNGDIVSKEPLSKEDALKAMENFGPEPEVEEIEEEEEEIEEELDDEDEEELEEESETEEEEEEE